MINLTGVLILSILIGFTSASAGDNSPFYQKCLERCSLLNCTADGNFIESNRETIISKITLWHCEDECKYECMWKTVDAFHRRKWRTPQFYGKWPFIKILGLQEPASVIFSLMNAYMHVKMIRIFRAKVTSDAPFYWFIHISNAVYINSWIWSTVFHARDIPFTECMDYVCAFSMVLMGNYHMAIRLLRRVPTFVMAFLTTFYIAFFINHAVYLYSGRFDYWYNMQLNVTVGATTVFIWFMWALWFRRQRTYVINIAIWAVGVVSTTILEVFDYPPLFYTFDFHSLWHFSTVPTGIFYYRFFIDDCKYLKKLKFETDEKKNP